MSIVDEIQRIKNNIANAYLECETKGATIPENKNSENLPETINSIQNKGVSSKHNITMDNIFGDVDSDGLLQSPAAGNLVASGIIKVDDYKLACKFGGNAWGVTRPQGLATILFPDLTYIGNAALSYFCTYSTDLESVSFPELEEIGQCGMYCGFQHNTNLKTISFPKLKTLSGMYASLNSVCAYCTNLEIVNLDSLTSLTSRALSSAFQNCKKLKTLSFPSLNPQSFNNYNDQFHTMLASVSDCTVHFPYSIKKVISEWQDVISGFGGNNTIILFDLHAVYLNFISDKQNIEISVNDEIFTEMSGYAVAGDIEYACYSQDDNLLLLETLNNLEENSVVDINVNFAQTINKVTLNVGISGLDVTFYAGNLKIPAVEESNGNYVLNVIGQNKNIRYYINGENNYSDAEGVINLTGENITQNADIYPVTLKTFVRPNLTENGELGGNSFAAASTGDVSSSYGVYKVFNGNETDYFWANADINTITFYNPQALRVSSLVIEYYSSSSTYLPASITVQGSNNNTDWEDIASFEYETGLSRTLNINSQRFYKYHRLIMPEKSVYLRICEIEINASYKE